MLANAFLSALSRSISIAVNGGGRARSGPGSRRSSDRYLRGASMSLLQGELLQGEVVQFDAIGYSEEELIAREIKTHREAIALYEDKANGSDAQLRAFAQQILPQLQQHLAMLETLKSENTHARR